MKINRITLKNIRNITSRTIEFGKTNIITGPNGSGKSTLLSGIRVALTGKSPADYLRAGTSVGYVEVDVEGLGTVSQGWKNGKGAVGVNGKGTTRTSVAETLKNVFGVSPTLCNIMTSSDALLATSSGDLGAFLIDEKFLKLETDIENMVICCSFTADAEKEIRGYMPAAPEKFDSEAISTAYDDYFDMRRQVKRDLASAQAQAKVPGISKPARSAEEIKAEQNALLVRIGEQKAAAAAYEAAKRAYNINRQGITNAEREITELNVERPNEVKIQENREQTEKAIADMADKRSLFASLDKVAVNYEKTLDELNTSKCPISEKLTCNTDKTVVKAELLGLLNEVADQMSKLEDQIKVLENDIETRKSVDAETKIQAQKYNKKLVALQRLEDLKKADIKEPDEFSGAELVKLEAMNAGLSKDYQDAIAYQSTVKAQKEVAALTAKLAAYNNILEQLSPKSGIRKILLEQAMEPIEEYVNEQIKDLLPGRAFSIDTGDGLEFLVKDPAGNTIGLESLSSSEKIRAALIIQDIINELSGFRILIIDNIDSFDNDSCRMVMTYIADKHIQERYDSIFVAGLPNSLIDSLADSLWTKIGKPINLISM